MTCSLCLDTGYQGEEADWAPCPTCPPHTRHVPLDARCVYDGHPAATIRDAEFVCSSCAWVADNGMWRSRIGGDL